jgi:hypothetical protein
MRAISVVESHDSKNLESYMSAPNGHFLNRVKTVANPGGDLLIVARLTGEIRCGKPNVSRRRTPVDIFLDQSFLEGRTNGARRTEAL